MKLIADSGSTKTDWYLIDGTKNTSYTTQGYNPYYFTSEEIRQDLEQKLLNQLNAREVKELYFYGSGCANPITEGLIRGALQPLFAGAVINLGDDLLAAARATAGREAGICCILGTGSNSCFYDGTKIADKIPSLGYILGDEGAGASIGKELIRAYFYRDLPQDLALALEEEFVMDKHQIITNLLEGKTPNRFLASFALFALTYQAHPFVEKIIKNCFEDFLKCHVLKYSNAKSLPIHFIGSIAFGHQSLLKQVLERHHLSIGKVSKSPFPNLLAY